MMLKTTRSLAYVSARRYYATLTTQTTQDVGILHQQQVTHTIPDIPTHKQIVSIETKSKTDINKSGRIWGWNADKQKIESMIRVDQAGEFGAVTICKGQRIMLLNDQIITEIQSQEEEHLKVMEDLMRERRVRPTILNPLWHVAGFTLGVSTAILGRPAAMACHKAVEDVISKHYNDQIREIYEMASKEDEYNNFNDEMLGKIREERLEKVLTEEEKKKREMEYLFTSTHQRNEVGENELRTILKRFRDEELHHGEMAVENNAKSAPFYSVIYNTIKGACVAAIWLSKRI